MSTIDSSFPSQGEERHLSNEGRTQMAGDLIHVLHIDDKGEMPGKAGQEKNIQSLRDRSKPLDTTNITAMPNLHERLQRVLKGK